MAWLGCLVLDFDCVFVFVCCFVGLRVNAVFCACLCVYGCRLRLCVWRVVLVCGLDCAVGV